MDKDIKTCHFFYPKKGRPPPTASQLDCASGIEESGLVYVSGSSL